MQFFILISCAFICFSQAEETLERQRRQSVLDVARDNAIRQSINAGGFTASGAGNSLYGSYGRNVWQSGKNRFSLGGGVGADVALNRPFVANPALTAAATYSRGLNSFSLSASRQLGPMPSNQIRFTYNRPFNKRSVDDSLLTRERRQPNNPALDEAVANSLTNKGPARFN